MDTVVVRALHTFEPQLIIVGCGFDPSILDPLSHTMVSASGFASMAERVKAVASEVCEGRLVMVQDGGYSIHYLAICGALTIAALTGVRPIDDPYWFLVENLYGRAQLEIGQKQAIAEEAQELSRIPGRLGGG